MSTPSSMGYQNQKCHFEHHSARNYVYFSARFPEIPSYCNCVLHNTKHFSSFSRSSPVLWKESGLSFSLTSLPFLSFHLCPITSSKKTSFPTCHLKPRLWETPPFPPPARAATVRALHAAAGATPVASTSQGTTGGFRLNHISQAFAPSTNLAASSPALRELPHQVEHQARRGAGGKGRWRKRSATCAGPGSGGAQGSGQARAAVTWGKEGRVLCASQSQMLPLRCTVTPASRTLRSPASLFPPDPAWPSLGNTLQSARPCGDSLLLALPGAQTFPATIAPASPGGLSESGRPLSL